VAAKEAFRDIRQGSSRIPKHRQARLLWGTLLAVDVKAEEEKKMHG
jgi:hypothetical protein